MRLRLTLLFVFIHASRSHQHRLEAARVCRIGENSKIRTQHELVSRSLDLASLQLRGGSENAGKKKRRRRKKSGGGPGGGSKEKNEKEGYEVRCVFDSIRFLTSL